MSKASKPTVTKKAEQKKAKTVKAPVKRVLASKETSKNDKLIRASQERWETLSSRVLERLQSNPPASKNLVNQHVMRTVMDVISESTRRGRRPSVKKG